MPFRTMFYEDTVIDAGASVGGSFHSRESAEEWLSIHSPDAAIIDVKLQHGNSAELAKKLCGQEIPLLGEGSAFAGVTGPQAWCHDRLQPR
jgi:hypothetical protein